MASKVSPILLAAGQSTRFGSDKLLHPLSHSGKSKSLILHAIRPWLSSFAMVNIVVRSGNHALITMLRHCEFSSHLKLINAIDAETGMSASLRSGINATQQADAWLISLADMPFIHQDVIQHSLEALSEGAKITQTEFSGKRGHPVGFSSRFLPNLLALEGDKGAKEILHASADLITVIASPDDGILRDIDNKESLKPDTPF